MQSARWRASYAAAYAEEANMPRFILLSPTHYLPYTDKRMTMEELLALRSFNTEAPLSLFRGRFTRRFAADAAD